MVEDLTTLKQYTSWTSRENPRLFQCACDSGARVKPIDPFGYHLVGCKKGANAIPLHDEVVAVVSRLFRSLRVDAIVENPWQAASIDPKYDFCVTKALYI